MNKLGKCGTDEKYCQEKVKSALRTINKEAKSRLLCEKQKTKNKKQTKKHSPGHLNYNQPLDVTVDMHTCNTPL